MSAWLLGCAIATGASSARADVVTLPGGRLRGIIVNETDEHLQVQIAWGGFVTLDKAAVGRVAREDERVHDELRAKWHEHYQAAKERERRRRQLEESQAEQGLVQHRGRWISRDDLALTEQAEHEARERRDTEREWREQLEQERAERERISTRLQALEEENASLRVRARSQPSVIYVAQPVFARRRLPPLEGPVYQDEHGNLIRVQDHDRRPFITTPDGRRVDLQRHDRHLAFTDEQGAHHDLRRFSPPLISPGPLVSSGVTDLSIDVLGR